MFTLLVFLRFNVLYIIVYKNNVYFILQGKVQLKPNFD